MFQVIRFMAMCVVGHNAYTRDTEEWVKTEPCLCSRPPSSFLPQSYITQGSSKRGLKPTLTRRSVPARRASQGRYDERRSGQWPHKAFHITSAWLSQKTSERWKSEAREVRELVQSYSDRNCNTLLGFQTFSMLNQRPQTYQVSSLGSLKAETIMSEEM